jgi:conjugal transfer pilus assembly protein TraU
MVRKIILCVLVFFSNNKCWASAEELLCDGAFVNPITDVCWSCMLPITLGPVKVEGTSNRRDIANPSCPICFCKKGNNPLPIPGIPFGFWEPVRMIDITPYPWCLVNLNGIKLNGGSDPLKLSGFTKKTGDSHKGKSFYNVHYYVNPIIAIIGVLKDIIGLPDGGQGGCMEKGLSIDVMYVSELDPTWNDEGNAEFNES